MGGGIDLDDLTEEDLNKPLSILARDLTRKRRRKMRHATMMVLRPNASGRNLGVRRINSRREGEGSRQLCQLTELIAKESYEGEENRQEKVLPMPSAAEVMKKLWKIISKLVKKLHFLPDTNLKELFGKVDSLNVTKVKADLSHEFAGIAVISVSVPEDFDTTLQELAVSIKQQGDELCGKIPGELR